MTRFLPSLAAAKAEARAYRAEQAAAGHEISHSQALEAIARAHGHRDWNTFHAAIGNLPRAPVHVGQILPGHYLKQAFLAEVRAVTEVEPGLYDVELDFEQPVDVVTFDSFSNFRSRVRKRVTSEGRSVDVTSDGAPHLTFWS